MSARVERAANVAEIVSAFAVVIGIGLALFGYRIESQNRREEYTVNYAQSYFEGDLHAARSMIREVISLPSQVDPNVSDATLATIISGRVAQDRAGPLAQSVTLIGDYFNGAENCVRAGVCEDSLMRALHNDEAQILLCLLLPSLTALSLDGRESALLSGLEFFAQDRACDA